MSRIGGGWAGSRAPGRPDGPGRPRRPGRSRRPGRPSRPDYPGSGLRAPGSAGPWRCPADQDQDAGGELLIKFPTATRNHHGG